MDWRQQLADLRDRLFPTVTRSSLLRYYVPISGAISHTLYSAHIFAPQIANHLIPAYDLAVSNTVLFNSHVGIGFYVFFRKHMIRLNMWDRIEFSVFSSVLFNFGSLMFSVLLKALLPKRLLENTTLSSLLGASLSAWMITRGTKYLKHIDSRSVLPLGGGSRPTIYDSVPNGSIKKPNGVLPAIVESPVKNETPLKTNANGRIPNGVSKPNGIPNGFVHSNTKTAEFISPLPSEQRTMA